MTTFQSVAGFLILVLLCGAVKLGLLFKKLARLHGIEPELQAARQERVVRSWNR